MYTIRFNGLTSHADSLTDARRHVREYARRAGYAHGDVVFVACDDGIYAYEDQAIADADDTGTRAFAIIDRDDADDTRVTRIEVVVDASTLHTDILNVPSIDVRASIARYVELVDESLSARYPDAAIRVSVMPSSTQDAITITYADGHVGRRDDTRNDDVDAVTATLEDVFSTGAWRETSI